MGGETEYQPQHKLFHLPQMIQKQTSGDGRRYWRSLEEFQGRLDLDSVIDNEFAAAVPPATDGVSRRRWLQIMGASMAFGATLTGCRYPAREIAPFAFRPAGRTPGIPEQFSTMLEFSGVARPLVATCYDGRPIKLDGNPDHIDSRGGSDIFTQATILELYDPDRSRSASRSGPDGETRVTWVDAVNNFKSLVAAEGVAVLAEPCSSPTQKRLKEKLLAANPAARWFEFTSISCDNSDAGSRLAFGSVHRPVYRLDGAKVVLTLDADPLGAHPAVARLARDFFAARDPDHHKMNRLYSVESDLTKTGAMADHRLALRFDQVGSFLAALEAALTAGSATGDGEREKFLAAIVDDLLKNKGASVVMVGRAQPPEVHARAFRINSMLENFGKTIDLLEVPGAAENSGVEQLKELVQSIESGSVKTLIVLGGNPVFYAPSDVKLEEAIRAASQSVHVSYYRDETSRACKWHLNAAHPLESWGDGLSYDGTVLIAQPLINPLFDGYSVIEFLALLTGEVDVHDIEHHEPVSPSPAIAAAASTHVHHRPGLVALHNTHSAALSGAGESAWQKAVQAGFIAGSAAAAATPAVREMTLTTDVELWKNVWSKGDVELVFRPAPTIHDGRFANSGWLQELPDFITQLTWDNAALVNPVTADSLGMEHGKVSSFKVAEKSVSLPVYVLPGLADGTICMWLGYGRTAAGRVAGDADYTIDSIGTDIRPLRTSGNWWSVPTATVTPTSTKFRLAQTQDHFRIDDLGREEISRRMAPEGELLREGTWESYEKYLAEHGEGHTAEHEEDQAGGESHDHHSGWPGHYHLHFKNFDLTTAPWRDEKVPHKWGMAIDLNKCTGCSACVIACQAENNVPIVGKEQVLMSREMQWIRVDRYFITEKGDDKGANPKIGRQPMTCQQCEAAPCETVCPVAATTHSDEGLNDMVYNRCIGTRYCGNNCPFKVRRFNYLNYNDSQTFIKLPGADRLKRADLELMSMVMNPEVTVRSRGVMEKCTFCVQRIQNTKILARTEGNRPIGDNEIRTACQDVCPTGAIVFGDIQNEKSNVAAAHHNPRAYMLLEYLNIYPRTRYLARVRNSHPSLEQSAAVVAAH